jgi:hypothetical protein
LPFRQNGRAVGITLNSANSPPAEQFSGENPSPCPGEQGEFAQASMSAFEKTHVIGPGFRPGRDGRAKIEQQALLARRSF